MPSVAAAVPGIAGTMVAQQASAPLASGAKAVTTPLASTAKTMASPQPMKTKSAATPPTPAALPGKSGGKPYTLPPRAQSNVQVHFSPQVTVQGSGANAAKDINNVLSLSKRELERMINDVMAQQRRREYA